MAPLVRLAKTWLNSAHVEIVPVAAKLPYESFCVVSTTKSIPHGRHVAFTRSMIDRMFAALAVGVAPVAPMATLWGLDLDGQQGEAPHRELVGGSPRSRSRSGSRAWPCAGLPPMLPLIGETDMRPVAGSAAGGCGVITVKTRGSLETAWSSAFGGRWLRRGGGSVIVSRWRSTPTMGPWSVPVTLRSSRSGLAMSGAPVVARSNPRRCTRVLS